MLVELARLQDVDGRTALDQPCVLDETWGDTVTNDTADRVSGSIVNGVEGKVKALKLNVAVDQLRPIGLTELIVGVPGPGGVTKTSAQAERETLKVCGGLVVGVDHVGVVSIDETQADER